MSSTAIVPADQNLDAIEQALVKGNIGELSQPQRLAYYQRLCESLGLNPLTQPFEYLSLNGKVRLYAKKDATDQLRKLHGVSVVAMETQKVEDVHIVVVRVRDKEGREDIGTGAVALGSLKGEALANALMKGETKAKRRATLSICGLGFLDETEVDSIPRHERFEQAKDYEFNQSTPAECEREGCGKQIVGIVKPDGGKLTAEQAIAYSEKTHNASWCWECIIAAGKPKAEPPSELEQQLAASVEMVKAKKEALTPEFTEMDGKLIVSGIVTGTKVGPPFTLSMGKERFSTFSASLAEILKDTDGQRVVMEYKTAEKSGRTYKNIYDVRRIGEVEYDNGVPVTDINADLFVKDGEMQ
jgi:hypothetical protein